MQILILSALFFSKFIFGQKRDKELNDGVDPSNPIDRIDAANDFYMDWQEFKDDRFYNITSLSGGKTLNNNRLNFLLKIPFVTTDLTFETKFGFGDISVDGQANFPLSNKNSFVSGIKFIFPTASENEMGFGKYIMAPQAGLISHFKSGFWGIIISDYFSYAGKDDRKDVHEISFLPNFKINMGKAWYSLTTPDIRYNFISSKWFIPFTQEFGKLFGKNWEAAMKAGGHLYNADKRYDWNTQIRLSYLFN